VININFLKVFTEHIPGNATKTCTRPARLPTYEFSDALKAQFLWRLLKENKTIEGKDKADKASIVQCTMHNNIYHSFPV
jgi:hypothetical protein